MNTTDLHRYRSKLIDMRNRLAGEIGRLAETVMMDAQPVGEHDRAVSEAIDKEILIESTEEGIQQQVREALKRIEQGTYGLCQECAQVIGKPRLDAVPYTAYCISCERDRERSQRGPGAFS